MSINFIIDPPKIVPWLSPKEREANVVLLDFDADIEDEETVRIDLNVVFNPKSVRRGWANRVDYYVGSTGAEITVKAEDGSICDHTQAAKIDVSYTNTNKQNRKVSLALKPAVKTKVGTDKIDANIGTITREAASETSFTASFASEERYLTPVLMRDTIKWTVTLPRGERAIRDFLMGNLYLFAKFKWSKAPKSGTVSVRPSDVRCFNSDRRPISGWRSLLMLFIISDRFEDIENRDGFCIAFEEAE